jgi:hypothetical protein
MNTDTEARQMLVVVDKHKVHPDKSQKDACTRATTIANVNNRRSKETNIKPHERTDQILDIRRAQDFMCSPSALTLHRSEDSAVLISGSSRRINILKRQKRNLKIAKTPYQGEVMVRHTCKTPKPQKT